VIDVRLCAPLWQTLGLMRFACTRFNRLLSLLTSTLLLSLATGCHPPPPTIQTVAQEYVARLANLLGELPSYTEPSLPPLPSARQLTLGIETQTITAIEFARLHQCDLGDLVGQRNSVLGRVAGASARLAEDLIWLTRSPACIAAGATWLQPLMKLKRKQLPLLYWNAVFASPEFSSFAFANRAVVNLQAQLAGPDTVLLDLLDQQRGLQDLSLDVSVLNTALQRLTQGQTLGIMRQQWRNTRLSLIQAAKGLEELGHKVCRNGAPTPKARYLKRVFEQYYRDQLQPALARPYAVQQRTINALQRLLDANEIVAPASYRRWHDQVLSVSNNASEWRRTQLSLQRHANAWQRLFASCALPLTGSS